MNTMAQTGSSHSGRFVGGFGADAAAVAVDVVDDVANSLASAVAFTYFV